MSLVEALVVPSAPLLVPALAGGSAPLDSDLRETVLEAVALLVGRGDEDVVVVGRAPASRRYEGAWDWRGFGLPRRTQDQERLPLALALGDWLLDEVQAPSGRALIGVDPSSDAPACAAQGAALVADRDRRLLVVGDGSACRSEKAPGHLDPRAEGYDDAVEQALERGDAEALLALQPALGEDLLVGGRAAVQVLAGASWGQEVNATLLWSGRPYGVSYWVSRWVPVR